MPLFPPKQPARSLRGIIQLLIMMLQERTGSIMRIAVIALVVFAITHPTAVLADRAKNPSDKRVAEMIVKPTPAETAPAVDVIEPLRARGGGPSCSMKSSGETARRCLVLVDRPAPSVQTAQVKPVASSLSVASQSWLGALSKIVVTKVASFAGLLESDRNDWKVVMAAEIQWELEQAQTRERERSRQLISQGPTRGPAGSQPRRYAGAQF